MAYQERLEVITGMVAQAGDAGPKALSEMLNALVEGIAMCLAAVELDAPHDEIMKQVCEHICERGAELRESFLRFAEGDSEPCRNPACPVHGTRH